MDAFDADVLIYAAVTEPSAGDRACEPCFRSNRWRRRESSLASALCCCFRSFDEATPEGASRPGSTNSACFSVDWTSGRLTKPAAELAVALGAGLWTWRRKHGPPGERPSTPAPIDPVADNASDFPKTIAEVDVTYPPDLKA